MVKEIWSKRNVQRTRTTLVITSLWLLAADKKVTLCQWKGINCKQSTRWQYLSRLKASAFFSLQKFFSCYETQQLILGTGTAIWWVTEPHCHYAECCFAECRGAFVIRS
jgi:hypothetical protein